MSFQEINPNQDYDYIHTVTQTSENGTIDVRFYGNVNSPLTTGNFYYRMGTSGRWSAISRANPQKVQFNSRVFQVQYNEEIDQNSLITISFEGNKNIKSLKQSQRAPFQGDVGAYFMFRYAYQCSALEELDIPDTSLVTNSGVYFLYGYAYQCSALEELDIPDTSQMVTTYSYFMSYYANECSNLKSLGAPDLSNHSNQSVGNDWMQRYANQCTSLKTLQLPILPDGFQYAQRFLAWYALSSPSIETLLLPQNVGFYENTQADLFLTEGHDITAYSDEPQNWKPLLSEGRFLEVNGFSNVGKHRVYTEATFFTPIDLGSTLNVQETKLEQKISQEQDNTIQLKEDGLYSEKPELGSMAEKDTQDYLTKSEIESDYVTKDSIQGDLTDCQKTEDFNGKLGFEDLGDYYDQLTVDGKIQDLPKDKFLKSQSLSQDGKTLSFEVENGSTVTVNVEQLIPVSTEGAVIGTGTAQSPLELDSEVLKQELELGSMAFEDSESVYSKESQETEQVFKTDLSVLLQGFGGNNIGVLSQGSALLGDDFSDIDGLTFASMVSQGNYDEVTDTGYFGVVPKELIMTTHEFKSHTGVFGDVINQTSDWLKFYVGENQACNHREDKTPYVAYIQMKNLVKGTSWDDLNSAEILYEDGNKIWTKNGVDFEITTMTGLSEEGKWTSQQIQGENCALNIGGGSHWNELIYRVCDNTVSDCSTPHSPQYPHTYHGGNSTDSKWAQFTEGELDITSQYTLTQYRTQNNEASYRGSYSVSLVTRQALSNRNDIYGSRPLLIPVSR